MKKTTLRHLNCLNNSLVRLYADMKTEDHAPPLMVDGWRNRLAEETLRLALIRQYEEEDAGIVSDQIVSDQSEAAA